MNIRHWLSPLIALLLAFVGLSVLLVAVLAAPSATVSGSVVDLGGEPVVGAVVRRQTTAEATASDAEGSFVLAGLPEGTPITVTAWQEGYLVGWAVVVAPQEGVTITLKPHYTSDNPFYEWFSSNDPDDPISCVHCMVAHPQWQGNAHGNAGTNPRFFSLYNGTDLTGTTTVAPGYKLDFPGTAGNCATCHAPAAAVRGQRTFAAADMNDLQGVEAEGVFCEFCHKAGGVYLNPATGLPYNNAPGVLSMRLYRPASGGAEQLFFGPFDDVTRRVSYLELEKKSQFCAPCHQFGFWGTPIYESFREWLESPYPAQGIECQTCHMKPAGVDYFVFPEQGGLIRDPDTIASHLQPGAADEELLQNTVTMTVAAQQVAGAVEVTVTITNTEAGHHVPTDHPGRHMILTITATDGQGQPLAQQDGPIVPEWGGAQAGLPGKVFAKVLRDVQTGEAPVVSYWKQVLIVDDNRIPAMGSDMSVYAFAVPAVGGPVTVTAELRFRRTFQAIMEAKGWDEPDIVMEKVQTLAQAPTATATATRPAAAIRPAVVRPAALSATDKWALWTGPTYLRGANIYQRRVYPELDGPEFMGPGPVGPPYTQQDFDRLAAMGANYVNVSHPGLFAETPPFALDRDIQDNLDNLLSMIAQANMFAVVSFRTGPGRAEFSVCCLGDDWFPENYLNDEVWEEQAAQDAWVEMWRYTAERYRDNPIVVGYDLMVEPNANEVLSGEWLDPEEFYAQYGDTLADWNQFYPRITAAIRQVDSLTPILIGGMGYSGVEWLPYLEPTGDPRTVYMVHQYAPYLYTHQWRDSLDCTYPGFCDVDWNGEYDDWLDRDWLEDLLVVVDGFSAAHDVPVAVNEFGIIRWVPGAAEFMNDQMDLFEQRGMNHALWLWETSWPPIQDEIDAFNFRHGPDPQNHDDVSSSDLMDVILDYWERNTIRPSSTLTKTMVFLPGVLTSIGAKTAPLV